MSDKQASFSDHLFNYGLLVIIFVVILLPGSPLRTWVAEWRARFHLAKLVETHWEELAATSARLDTTAKVHSALIIEFGDYTCAFCRRVHPHIKEFMETNPNITIGFRHYTRHPVGQAAARAAICAESQGRFIEMHSLLLESDDWQATGNLLSLAERADVSDLTEFERCLSGEVVEKRLEEDMHLAEMLEITGVPVFFYAFGAHVGYLNADQLAELIALIR